MGKVITQEQFVKGLAICSKGKHKLRENDFGVVFCVRCGLLSTSVGNAEKLTADDKVIVNCKNE
jgi:Zn ribbon nucleic-acid-binding protein